MKKIDKLERYEILARVFERTTGMLAPGKDSRSGVDDHRERRVSWEVFLRDSGKTVDRTIEAVEYVLGVEVEE